MTDRPIARALTATYRVQLHKDWPLAALRAAVPYLHRLGISHVYTSPVLKSRPGSTHGYDVADPLTLDPELGCDGDRRALAAELHRHGMGWMLDIVPNHMGTGPANPYWEDVLARGRASRYAHWFDIDWDAPQRWLNGRVMVPVLGDELDAVLERGELSVVPGVDGRYRIQYFDHSFPIAPETERLIRDWGLGTGDWRARRGQSLAPPASPQSPVPSPQQFRALLDAQHYALASWRRAAREINYRRFFDISELIALRTEDPAVFAETHARILEWVGDGTLDGLRIDHIDGLYDPLGYLERLRAEVGARSAGAGTTGRGLGTGRVPAAGGRVGLAGRWRSDLGAAHGATSPQSPVPSPPSAVPTPQPFPIVVEKILSPGEHLRPEWPVQGTTGYEFLNDLEAVFIDPAGFATLEASYRRLLRARRGGLDFAEIALRGKAYILRHSLRADVSRLARLLAGVVRDRAAAVPAREQLAEGIVQLIAALPVYRTYIDGRTPDVHPDDRAVIERALARARHRAGGSGEVLDLLAGVLLGPTSGLGTGDWGLDAPPGGESSAARGPASPKSPVPSHQSRFIGRFQQTSGPATAKGVEDTALYIYIPLASRNEVGGEPDRDLRDAVDVFHRGSAERLARWARALNCTNTHDTKRSADVRARLDVLSEIPDEWAAAVGRWQRANGAQRRQVAGRLEPDANTEYVLYQSLVGIWPLAWQADRARHGALPGEGDLIAPSSGAPAVPPRDVLESLRRRLELYVLKAAREAKLRTSWTEQNESFEGAVTGFLHGILGGAADSPFLLDVSRLVGRIGRPGLWNALSRVLVHLTAPGTPDLYQGDELWNFSLVDPDNRRPVDYEYRGKLLAQLEGAFAATGTGNGERGTERAPVRSPFPVPRSREQLISDLVAHVEDGRLKLYITRRLLHARRADPALWMSGAYEPLAAEGERAGHAVAFARRVAARVAVSVAARLTLSLTGDPTRAPVGREVWGDTVLRLPRVTGARLWTCAVSGHSVEAAPSGGGDVVRLADVFRLAPVALLTPSGDFAADRGDA